MTTSESKGRFFLQNEYIRIDSNRIANWNTLLITCLLLKLGLDVSLPVCYPCHNNGDMKLIPVKPPLPAASLHSLLSVSQRRGVGTITQTL